MLSFSPQEGVLEDKSIVLGQVKGSPVSDGHWLETPNYLIWLKAMMTWSSKTPSPTSYNTYIAAYNVGIARLLSCWCIFDRICCMIALRILLACPQLTFKNSIPANSSHSQMHLQRFSLMKFLFFQSDNLKLWNMSLSPTNHSQDRLVEVSKLILL